MKSLPTILTVCCLIVGVTFAFASTQDPQKKSDTKTAATQEPAEGNDDDGESFEPIDNMHHFMEYISQPSYRSLKKSFAGEAPENRKGWKSIKSHALILAETSALVADRFPQDCSEEQASQWRQISLEVYTAGKQLYKSAGDFDAAKKNYGVMIESCNKCHQVFDNGKHQLKK
jgi:hypothetical protein